MANKVWTDEEVQNEIKAAVAIVNEDRERADYARLHGKYGQQDNGDGKEGEKQEDKSPPAKQDQEDPKDQGKKQKRSIWWGDVSDE